MDLRSIGLQQNLALQRAEYKHKTLKQQENSTTAPSVLYSNTPFKNANYLHFGHDLVKQNKTIEETKQSKAKSSEININKISTDSDTQEVLERLIALISDAKYINPYECIYGYQGLDKADKETYKKLLELAESGKVSLYALRGWNNSQFDEKYAANIDIYYKALKNGSDENEIADLFIPTVKSIDDGLNKVQTGETFETNGILYYKTSDNEAERLDLSKKTFFNLFHPIEPVCQGFASDCWVLSPIISMLDDPKTRIKLFRCFQENDEGIKIKLPNSITSIKADKEGNLPQDKMQFSEHYAKGSKGVQLLESAFEKEYTYTKSELIIKIINQLMTYNLDALSEEEKVLCNDILNDCLENPTKPKYIIYYYGDKEIELISRKEFPEPLLYNEHDDYGIYKFSELQETDFKKTELFTSGADLFYRANCGPALDTYRLLGQSVLDNRICSFSNKNGSPVNDYNLYFLNNSTDYFITGIGSESTEDKEFDLDKGIFPAHDYSLKIEKDPKTGEIKYILKNPYNSARKIIIDEKKLKEYFEMFYAAYKNS